MCILAEFHARYEMIHPFQDGNGRTGRMILFRECLKYPELNPFIILDINRDKYIEGLKEYRDNQKTEKLVLLMNQEIEDYYSQCKYFMNDQVQTMVSSIQKKTGCEHRLSGISFRAMEAVTFMNLE